MTQAPADLLELRSRIQARTGLTAVELGIVGDSAHAATGGYHEGRTDLERAGVVGSDYSTRLPRDRAGLTESASAIDIGARWAAGRSVWLRFNAALVAALHANEPALAAVRAVNYTDANGATLRTDREHGWSTESNSDRDHTHVEWYRDTEGNRQASLDRLVQLVDQVVAGGPVAAPPPAGRPAPGPAIAFPLPSGYYFGPKSGPAYSVSGFYGRVFNGRTDAQWLQEWASQLARRGWSIGVGKTYLCRYGNDGHYGPEYAALATAFQRDQRIGVDALIGRQTWDAAYLNPVT